MRKIFIVAACGLVACATSDATSTNSSSVQGEQAGTNADPSGGANAAANTTAANTTAANTTTANTTAASQDAGTASTAPPPVASSPDGDAPASPTNCVTSTEIFGDLTVDTLRVNNQGTVVANYTVLGDRNPPQRTAVLANGVRSELVALGGPDRWTQASAINDRGEIVGWSIDASGATRPTLWKDGVPTDLGTLGGGSGAAVAINADGDIVGGAVAADGTSHGFLWRKGVMTDLGGFGGSGGSAAFVNARAQVLGSVTLSNQPYPSGFLNHTYFWSEGSAVELYPRPSTEAVSYQPRGLNATGEAVITGASYDSGFSAWRWSAGTFTPVRPFDDTFSVSIAGINDRGDIAGDALRGPSENDSTGPHGFILRNGVMTAIVTSTGSTFTSVTAMEAHGQVAGAASAADGQHPFTWMNGKYVALTDAPAGESGQAVAMNDRGQILVRFYDARDGGHYRLKLFNTAACFDDYTNVPPSKE